MIQEKIIDLHEAFLSLKVIENDEDNRHANALVFKLASKPQLTEEESRLLELLIVLVHTYENKKYDFPLPTAKEAVEFHMEQTGLKQKDLVHIFGTTSRVSEFLAGKRPLTLEQARRLNAETNIPLEILIKA